MVMRLKHKALRDTKDEAVDTVAFMLVVAQTYHGDKQLIHNTTQVLEGNNYDNLKELKNLEDKQWEEMGIPLEVVNHIRHTFTLK